NRRVNGEWETQRDLVGVPILSDPVAVTAYDRVYVFARSQNLGMWHGHFDAGVWSGWAPIQGSATSNLTAAANSNVLWVSARASDGQLWARNLFLGSSGPEFGQWQNLGGDISSDPVAVADGSSVWVFARRSGRGIWYRRSNGSSFGPWQGLGGSVVGDPKAVM